MHTDIRLLTYAAILAWLQILVAAGLRTNGNLFLSLGNRGDLPEPSPMAARADRAARNMLENLVLFVALALVAHLADRVTPTALLGAQLFFWGRVAHAIIYIAGIPWLRTAAFAVSVVGLLMIASQLI